jgi:hypothetical protein
MIETHSPIISANSGCAADMETGITVLLCVGKKNTDKTAENELNFGEDAQHIHVALNFLLWRYELI